MKKIKVNPITMSLADVAIFIVMAHGMRAITGYDVGLEVFTESFTSALGYLLFVTPMFISSPVIAESVLEVKDV